jgi:hypothetical protein
LAEFREAILIRIKIFREKGDYGKQARLLEDRNFILLYFREVEKTNSFPHYEPLAALLRPGASTVPKLFVALDKTVAKPLSDWP